MKVSIIIPVYNVSDYVERCLNSVMAQTYTDLECVIVDDCTPDDSISKCQEIIDSYSGAIDFKIIHHGQNRGLSAARNTGINAAKGEYLFFLDSDDWISPDCINLMVKSIVQDDSIEMVMGGIKRVGDDMQWTHFLKKGVYTSNFIEYACSYRIYTMAWNKLLRADFIRNNNLFFKEGLLHEDILWNVQVACYLKKMVSIEDTTYFYLIREGSIQTNKSTELHHIHLGNVKLNLISFIFEKGLFRNKTLYQYITSDLPSFINCKIDLAKAFYQTFRSCPYWSLYSQKQLGATRRQLVLSLNRYLPKTLGLLYYRRIYKLLF